jgi:hypothetical protein
LVWPNTSHFFLKADMNGKTKKVHGVDCQRHAFAYAPDEQNTATWMLPIFIPGDAQKSLNAVKSSLHRFNEANIPDNDKQTAFDTLRGALLAHGIVTARRTFAPKNEAPTPAAEPTLPPVTVKKDPEIEQAVALADMRASQLLRSLGWE